MGALAAVVDGYVTLDPTTLDDVTLGEEILEIEQSLRRLSAAQADRLRVFDARDAAVGDGLGSASAWLVAKTGNTGFAESRRAVGLGRDLPRVPLFAAALADGAITAAHVRTFAAAARRVGPDLAAAGEAPLLVEARRFDPAAFAKLVAHWLRRVDETSFERDEERRLTGRTFSLAQTLDGIWHGHLRLDPEGGARLHLALQGRAQKAGPHDDRSRDQRWADALVSLADEVLAFGQLPDTAGHRPEVIVHATQTDLTHDENPAQPGTARLDDGTPLTRQAFNRIACDSRWSRLLLDALSVPVDYGRTRRDWPPTLRKLITLRDGGCRWGNCPMPASACEVHHCTYWEHGGDTCASNGLLLCRWHHTCIHTRGHQIKLLPDHTAETTLPDGRTITSRPRGPTPALL